MNYINLNGPYQRIKFICVVTATYSLIFLMIEILCSLVIVWMDKTQNFQTHFAGIFYGKKAYHTLFLVKQNCFCFFHTIFVMKSLVNLIICYLIP